MQEAELDWPLIVSTLLAGQGRERDIAAWRTCADVVSRLAAYAPGNLTEPDGWTQSDRDALSSLRRLQGEELAAAAANIARVFGAWRCHVTEHETAEARKLEMLVWTLGELYKLRERASEPAKVDSLAVRIGDVLVLAWRAPDVPTSGDYRKWAQRCTRRMDALPRAWRFV